MKLTFTNYMGSDSRGHNRLMWMERRGMRLQGFEASSYVPQIQMLHRRPLHSYSPETPIRHSQCRSQKKKENGT